MDNPLGRQGPDSEQPSGSLSTSLQIFDANPNWRAGLIQLTEEEQKAAGIYLAW